MKLSAKTILSVFGAFLLGLVTVTTSFADDQLYVISANAGGVSEVSGKVTVNRAGKSSDLTTKDQLKAGEIVTTAADAKLEILLNPGSYLRLGGNSEFEFAETSLDKLSLKLTRGSAILEVLSVDNIGVIVNTPKNRINFQYSGVYRIDLAENGTTTVGVIKGKVELNGKTAVMLKSKRQASMANGEITVSKFDTKNGDFLTDFSKTRAKEIANLNQKLSYRDVRSAFGFYDASNSGSIYRGIYGYWVLDRRTGRYCFIPFSPFDSPYGIWFGGNMYDCVPNWNWNGMPMGGSSGGTILTVKQPVTPTINRSDDTPNSTTKEGSPRYEPRSDTTPRYEPAPKNDTPVYSPPPKNDPPPPRDETPVSRPSKSDPPTN